MTPIYLLRHQHGGILAKYAFTTTPNDAQMEVIGKDADAVFGEGWISVHELSLIDDGTVPLSIEQQGADEAQVGATSGGSFSAITGQGYGTVGVPTI